MGLLDLLFQQEESLEEIKERIKERECQKQERKLDDALAKVRFFPGSQEEYEAHAGYPVRIIDTGSRNIGVTFGMANIDSDYDYSLKGDFHLKKKLVDEGIEALINCNYSLGDNLVHYHRIYGLPVAKK